MSQKHTIHILHHMARTGGTVISRCLGCMDTVVLLSEIHPAGTERFDPLDQARRWFDLVDEQEVARFRSGAGYDFHGAIRLIAERCRERDCRLVLRDWSHLDYTGIPFVPEPGYRFSTAEVLGNHFDLRQVATVRHPLDQLLSLSRLGNMQGLFDAGAILKGMRRFAEDVQPIGFFRYEDLLERPDEILRGLCTRVDLPFDPAYRDRWANYDKVTGDQIRRADSELKRSPRRQVPADLLREIEANGDYFAILELLGYEHDVPNAQKPTRETGKAKTKEDDPVKAVFDRANTLSGEEKFSEAAKYYRQVLDQQPNHEWALNNLGFCLIRLGDTENAAMYLRRCLEIAPENQRALANILMALDDSHQHSEVVTYRRRQLRLNPDDVGPAFALANNLQSVGRIDEALHYYRRFLEKKRAHRVAASNYLLALNYCDSVTPEHVTSEHFRLAQRWSHARCADSTFRQSHDAERRLKIAYLSCDYSTHPVGKTMQPIVAAHDKTRFEIICYSDGNTDDHWTKKTRESADQFHETARLSDEEFTQRLRADQIDVAVELQGHTGGRNRLGSLARGVAPIQMSFLGYPTTTGHVAVDYRITDEYCDPPTETEQFHSEELIRMKRGFLCYEPIDDLPSPDPLPAEKKGHITFGCFNNPTKVSPTCFRMWTRILKAVPESRLYVKYGNRFRDPTLQERWASEFAAAGVAPERIIIAHAIPTLLGHLQAIGAVDIAFDPYPYQGTHTTLETLSMGVPVVTLCGETYVRRASSALLMRLGFDELVAASPDEYVEVAVRLAKDRESLARLRAGIRTRFLNSEICDVAGYVAELEGVYRRLWAEWCEKNPAAKQHT